MTTPESIQVLHVDDEPEVVELTAEMLEREDNRITVETVTSASECLEHFTEREYDCIVSDYDMPEVTGIELLERVREEDGDFLFILFTGKGSEEIASDAISAGVTDYLQKQADSDQYTVLANRLTNAVEQYRAKQRLEKRERELERERERLDTVVSNIPVVVFALDPEGVFTLSQGKGLEVFGLEPGEVVSQSVFEHYEGYETLLTDIERALDGKQVTGTYEVEGLVFETTLQPVFDDDGTVRAVIGVSIDITERNEREQKLEQTQQRFQTLYEQLSQPVVEVELDGSEPIVVDVNPAFEETFGYERDTISGESLDAYIVPEDRQTEAEEINEQIIDGRQPTSKEVTRLTATGPQDFLLETGLYDDSTGGFGIYTDITERKQQEHQLERKNARLSALFDQFPEPTLAYAYEDGEPYIRQVNKEFTETFGYDAEVAVGEHVDSLVVPPDRQTEAEQIDERVQAGDAVDELLRRKTRDGIREFRFRNIPLSENDIIDGYAIYADVTERKLRERELQRKERIIQEMDDGVVVVQDQTIMYTNPQVSEIIGYPVEELIGEPMGTYIAPEDRETVRRRYKERLAGNEPPKTYEISLLTRDGGTVPVEITAARVTYGDEPATVSIVRDITDRKERIRELERQNERLEEFASIVSHDLRNPLNVASSRLELAQDTCTSPHLTDIADAHERMERLIDDLLTLARQGEEIREMESVSVTALAGECWDIVETAEATLKTDAEVTIRADSNRLKQALENLIRNAVEHGSSGVMVRVGELPEEPGFYVADDGPGIPDDSHDEVFESGYSTAENGTGFGLAIVREIVEAHDWEITVTESDAGGARFEITGVDIVD